VVSPGDVGDPPGAREDRPPLRQGAGDAARRGLVGFAVDAGRFDAGAAPAPCAAKPTLVRARTREETKIPRLLDPSPDRPPRGERSCSASPGGAGSVGSSCRRRSVRRSMAHAPDRVRPAPAIHFVSLPATKRGSNLEAMQRHRRCATVRRQRCNAPSPPNGTNKVANMAAPCRRPVAYPSAGAGDPGATAGTNRDRRRT
jgi:hypothetical protein